MDSPLLLPLVVLFLLTTKLPCRAPGRQTVELECFLLCQPTPVCLELRVFRMWDKEGNVMRLKGKNMGAEWRAGEELYREQLMAC